MEEVVDLTFTKEYIDQLIEDCKSEIYETIDQATSSRPTVFVD